MSTVLAAGYLAKGHCSEACARAVTGLVRAAVQVTWHYLHYWTLAIVVPLGAAAAWLRASGDD